ncbi:hypothetical protein B0H63DRAFT_555978 [Podospora didyma]|uniref:mRNA export factor mex67 n=1 Tax=Podospora didyma TaxID=330526 RepID=A0AAE0P7P4_9PEZI|nr:hypothetical protein B0H63DRAFT_555978 [Podospora didyma]
MAPPTGPRGGSARTTAPRSSRGGGITKRRAAVKTDRDGDVAMDAPAGGPDNAGGSGRGNHGGRSGGSRGTSRELTRGASRTIQNIKAHLNRTTLKILGLRESKAASNSDGGLRGLVEFLQRKVKGNHPIRISKSTLNGDYAWISVSKEDAAVLLKLDGYTYAGAALKISETSEKWPGTITISPQAALVKENLIKVLANRYNPEQKLLDLSALGGDDILKSMNLFEGQGTAQKAFKALIGTVSMQYDNNAEAKKEAIESVSLARNGLSDVNQVFTLAIELPGLKRLDLSGNSLDTLAKISKWQHRFRDLQELHLTDNPVMTQENILPELLQCFPSMQILNGQQVRTPDQVVEALKALTPTPIPQFTSNVRDGENNVAAIFLTNFFPMFDSDRARLAAEFYDEDSWFSLSVIPNSGRPLPWKSYLKFSRNVNRISSSRDPNLVKRVFTGGSMIAEMWKALPNTQHPAINNPTMWLIDSHTFPDLADPSGLGATAGLLINVNGQFEESDPSANLFGTRTFSRIFILGPSKPSNPPAKNPYRVISDQLTLHDWKPQAVVAEQAPVINPTTAPAANPGMTAVTNPAVVNPVVTYPAVNPITFNVEVPDDMKARLIAELSQRTGMTAEFSELCLSGAANWNFESALKSFEDLKANLPTTAFTGNA